jgi:deoxyribodipyrimidine photolyase-like uncharacterized protein
MMELEEEAVLVPQYKAQPQQIGGNRRMRFQLRNLARKDAAERQAIAKRAETLKGPLTRQT